MPEKTHLDQTIIHAAAMLLDADSLITDGGLFLQNGRIADIGAWQAVRRRHPDVAVRSVGNHLVAPGLVNLHTHLELGYLRGKIAPMEFPNWVCKLFELAPAHDQLKTVISESVVTGIRECLRCGVTAVGDITRHPLITRAAAADRPIRGVSFGEITAMGRARGLLAERLAVAQLSGQADGRMRIGLSPHAPYSVEGLALQQIVQAAAANHQPLAMHLAELSYERDFLRDFSGPLGRDWPLRRIIDVLDDQIPCFDGSPVAWAHHWGLLNCDQPVILAHVNTADEADIQLLARAHNITVAMCPRTRHYFGHDRRRLHPCIQMLEAGVRVCLATDSLASNPDLNLLAEAACARHDLPNLAFDTLFRMITEWPADAIGINGGRLAIGRLADWAAFPLSSRPDSAQNAAAELIVNQPPAAATVIGSELVSGTLCD